MSISLRNISIHALMVSVLTSFVIILVLIAALAVYSDRYAEQSLHDLQDLAGDQMSQLNRADALLKDGRVNLELGSYYLSDGQDARVPEFLENAEDRLRRAERRFGVFYESPKAPENIEISEQIQREFAATVELMRQQIAAVSRGDIAANRELRYRVEKQDDVYNDLLTNFIRDGFDQSEALVERYDAHTDTISLIGLVLLIIFAGQVVMIYAGLRNIVIRPLNLAVDNLESIAKADLTRQIAVDGRNEMSRLFSAMRDMQENLNRIVGEVRSSSNSIHHGSREIALGNADLSSRTEQQAASLEETSSSMEQMTATVKQNADNARQASRLALDASGTASKGGEVVERVVTTMHGITDSSRKIADIIGVIDSIAFQTNILALNASVEAARAGEQGRGFAVVAGEVRNLASRSADAAKEIRTLIDGSVNQVQEGATLVEQAGDTMREIVAAVRRVTDIMDEISSASQEQSAGIDQITQAVGQMDQVTQQNAALVQQASAAAASLEEQAEKMEQVMAVFRISGNVEGRASLTINSTSTRSEQGSLPGSNAALRLSSTQKSDRKGGASEDDWQEF
ncbi:MAG: Tar ligand binding domain-containing protein [Halomonas sp.]|uniref:methyl-accepting chemotaxis protein n=1 Tax=Halomonas sp. TaxID=1486246 RepID=UPI001A0C15F6|nr:methyl-accepting chemotaxis protein [Halomonas sp.]MBE0489005.1 Tar ligand binding domain-containing protein [Halomonas sp.]